MKATLDNIEVFPGVIINSCTARLSLLDAAACHGRRKWLECAMKRAAVVTWSMAQQFDSSQLHYDSKHNKYLIEQNTAIYNSRHRACYTTESLNRDARAHTSDTQLTRDRSVHNRSSDSSSAAHSPSNIAVTSSSVMPSAFGIVGSAEVGSLLQFTVNGNSGG